MHMAIFTKMSEVVEPVLRLSKSLNGQFQAVKNSTEEQLSVMKIGEIFGPEARVGTWEVWWRGSRFCLEVSSTFSNFFDFFVPTKLCWISAKDRNLNP